DEELAANRCDYGDDIFSHPFDDDHYRSRSAAFDRITTPLLSAGNWGGQGLHLRGNVEGFGRAASDDKWLELHGLEHWTQFYTDGGVGLQKRFFGHFLKGENNGWAEQPRVLLRVRHLDHFEDRGEEDWPVPRTEWTRLFLDAGRMTMDTQPPSTEAAVSFEALGPGATFMAHPRDEEMELTGPIAAKLHVGSSTTDTDIFLVVRLFGPDGEEVTFQGAIDPHTPIAQGWLRASRRDLDPRLSRPWRPFHRHQAIEPLVPGEVYELHVEVWPTSIVIPPGYRLGLTVLGRDYEWGGDTSGLRLSQFKNELRGCGPFLHDDPRDRPPEIYGGTTLLHTGPDHPAHLLLPVIPPAG
ncbi:MAG: CocE/NonD family hydrolase C-terminal non-catalytic domain-containing protein, partial [Acidimicrobiia bacterium]